MTFSTYAGRRVKARAGISFSIPLLIVVTVSAATVTARTAQSSAKQRGESISGRVVDESGQPLREATVTVFGVGMASRPSRTTSTDEQGRFQVESLAAGPYRVTASEPVMVMEDDATSRYYRPGDQATIRMIRGGVITGTVTDSAGEPVVGVSVRAIRDRDSEGRPVGGFSTGISRTTDDRGIYRLFGIRAGIYRVVAGGVMQNPFEENAPTYYPSGNRDTAGQVQVRAGDEVRGIDIKYRGERGHIVSGTVASEPASSAQFQPAIQLVSVASGKAEFATGTPQVAGPRGFAIFGVPDGEYMLVAQSMVNAGGSPQITIASEPQRVVVKQADVTGLQLKLTPLASLAGRVTLEVAPAAARDALCKSEAGRVEEMLVSARRYSPQEETSMPWLAAANASTPTDNGDFSIQALRPGRYRLDVRLLNDDQYLKSISSQASQAAKAKDLALDGFRAGVGETIRDVSIRVAEGAAGLTGRVEGARPPEGLRVHLAPAEPESVNDVLRYYEAEVNRDGTFSIANVAPGRYSVVMLVSPVVHSLVSDRPRPLAWEAAMRTRIRNQVKISNREIELKPCERVKSLKLQFSGST